MLFLFFCSVKEETDWNELAFLQCMKCVAPRDEVGETLKCVHLKRATFGSGEKGDGVEREGR